jgi:PAS domain-containing protein
VREVDPLDIVETIREGLLVLEPDLTIRFANRAFCDKFLVAPEHTVGQKLHEIGNGEWDIPKLRIALLTKEHSRASKSNNSFHQSDRA